MAWRHCCASQLISRFTTLPSRGRGSLRACNADPEQAGQHLPMIKLISENDSVHDTG